MNTMLFCNNYTYYPVAKWCLEEVLGMNNYCINVLNCVFIDSKGGEFVPPEQIYISQDLAHPEDLQAIFHELRHYYQLKTGMFDFHSAPLQTPLSPEATEQMKKLQRYLDYQKYPWELDANEFAIQTLKQFRKTPLAKTYTPYMGRR